MGEFFICGELYGDFWRNMSEWFSLIFLVMRQFQFIHVSAKLLVYGFSYDMISSMLSQDREVKPQRWESLLPQVVQIFTN
jgi:hypothetical protein